jgi:hypothetical protein
MVIDQEIITTETTTEDHLVIIVDQIVVAIAPTINPEALIVTGPPKREVTLEKGETLFQITVSRKINFNQRLRLRTLTLLRKTFM